MTVLALDLASVSGWTVGKPGGVPLHGSIRFASVGASHETIFAKAIIWTEEMIDKHNPGLVVWESPMPPMARHGASNINTTTVLFGLPAVIGAVCYLRGMYDIRKAFVKDVRLHFIGSNPKGAVAKKLVKRQCAAMGWDVADDNEADALATWHYMCALIDPKLAIRPTPLFGRR